MTQQSSGYSRASDDLKAALREPIWSFVTADGAGRQALVRLRVDPSTLRSIGLDPSYPNHERFAALEGWIGLAGEHVLGSLDDATASALATVQTEALRTADDAGLWGLPPDVTASAIARHLILVGPRALPHLRPLLDDVRLAPYEGSETSSLAALRHYRVSDVAAALVAVIVGAPYRDAPTPAERDTQVAQLRTQYY